MENPVAAHTRVQSLAHDLIESGNTSFQVATQPQRVVFWMSDTVGACELVSANWTDRTGQAVPDALGHGWMQCVDVQDRVELQRALDAATKSATGLHARYRLLRSDGRSRWVLHHAAARFLPLGAFCGLVGTLHEEADGHAGELALERAAQQVYGFMDTLPMAAVAMGFDGRIVHGNRFAAALIGREDTQFAGLHWVDDVVSVASRECVSGLIGGGVAPAALPPELEYQIETAAGPRLLRWHLTLIRNFAGVPVSIAMMGTDITRWRAAGNQSRLTSQMFDASSEGMVITDRNNCIVTVNHAFTTLTGYTREEALGSNPRVLQSGRHDKAFYQAMWSSILEHGYWRGDIWDRRKDGTFYPKFLAISAIRDDQEEIVNFSAVFYDVTERKALEDKLDHLAHYDALTGLPNRMLLQDRLEQAIALAERNRQEFALLFVDLDGFKQVNDQCGHIVGDQVLQTVAQRMLALVRGVDTAARLGGDEFVIILTDIHHEVDVARVAAKLVEVLSQTYTVDGQEVALSASVGVSTYPSDQRVASELLRTADEAMYTAKREGKRQVRFYASIRPRL
jgi:diguanylate cyclase (GGDEF)-like protein/PAS domain S-box-containing protein